MTTATPPASKPPIHIRALRKAMRELGVIEAQPAVGYGNKTSLPRANLTHFPKLEGDHPTTWNFPAYLDNPSCAWLASLKDLYQNQLSFPASISPEGGLMLHGVVRNARPKVVIETGTFLSASAHWIASALKENGFGVLHCFDDFGPIQPGPWRPQGMTEDRLEWVKARLTRAGLIDHVRFHKGLSWDTLAAAREELRAAGGVDFAYIDGDHTIPGAVADFRAVEPVLNTGGFAMVHDTFPEQCGDHLGPRHVLDYANVIGEGLYEKVDLYLSPLNYGMGLLRRIG